MAETRQNILSDSNNPTSSNDIPAISYLNDLYLELIIDHSKRPRNRHRLKSSDREAEGFNPLCGDHIIVYLKLEDDIIKEVTFEGSGCAICTSSASLMTESLKDKTLAEGKELFSRFHHLIMGDPKETDKGPGLGKLEVFSGVSRYPARVKCATLPWHTVKAAMENSIKVTSTE